MIPRAPIPEIRDARGLEREGFEAASIGLRSPVVLRRFVAHWDWVGLDPNDLVAQWPSRTVFAHGISTEGLTLERIPLSCNDIGRYLAPDPARPPGDGLVIDLETEAPELLAKLPPPSVHAGAIHHRMFTGHGTITDTHYHVNRHNLICQVLGQKRLLLHAPDDSPHLYPRSVFTDRQFNTSQVDLSAPDLDRFPRVSKTRPLEALLDPGDALFIPVHWWHTVYGVGPVLSVSLFWEARLRHHRFPYPGVRNLTGKLRWQIWPKLRAKSARE